MPLAKKRLSYLHIVTEQGRGGCKSLRFGALKKTTRLPTFSCEKESKKLPSFFDSSLLRAPSCHGEKPAAQPSVLTHINVKASTSLFWHSETAALDGDARLGPTTHPQGGVVWLAGVLHSALVSQPFP
jgi:hypothetical protein